jgi:hypothetical protein
VLAFNFCLWELTHEDLLTFRQNKLLYNYLTLGMIAFCFADIKVGIVYDIHKQLNTISILTVLANFTIIILINHLLITKSLFILSTFNLLIFVITVIITISAKRHGFLSK